MIHEYTVDISKFIKSWNAFHLAKELEDDAVFQNFRIDYGALSWANGFDIAPEYIFFIANKLNEKYQTLFKDWGYIK